MSTFKSYKKESRIDWGTSQESPMDLSQIQTGAILRIADATEAMAKNHVALQDECDRLRKYHKWSQEKCEKLGRSNAALRGQITKLRKAMKKGGEK